MLGVYSIAETVDNSNKRTDKTIFRYAGEETYFDKHTLKSLMSTSAMIELNGAIAFESLYAVAIYLNQFAEQE